MVYLAIKWVDLSMAMLVITRGYNEMAYWCVLRRGWMGIGVARMIITSDILDHSRKFPAFSTSKMGGNNHLQMGMVGSMLFEVKVENIRQTHIGFLKKLGRSCTDCWIYPLWKR